MIFAAVGITLLMGSAVAAGLASAFLLGVFVGAWTKDSG